MNHSTRDYCKSLFRLWGLDSSAEWQRRELHCKGARLKLQVCARKPQFSFLVTSVIGFYSRVVGGLRGRMLRQVQRVLLREKANLKFLDLIRKQLDSVWGGIGEYWAITLYAEASGRGASTGWGGGAGKSDFAKTKKKKIHEAASEWAECLSHTLLSLPKIVSFPGIHTAPFPGTEEGTVF